MISASIPVLLSALASHFLVPVILEAALRALFAAVAVWAGLRLLGVANVLVQKAAWGLVLIAALAMPLAPRRQILPASAAFRLPAFPWSQALNAEPNPQAAPAPDRYPAPSISKVEFDDSAVSAPLVSPVTDESASSSEPASPPHSGAPESQSGLKSKFRNGAKSTFRTALKGTGFSPYISATKRSRALAPEGPLHQSNSLPISIPTPKPFPLASFAWLLYLGIFAVLLLRLLFGLASALRLWLTAEPVTALPAIDSATALRLRSSPRVSSPVNVGSGIILPAGYATWDEEKLRIVLAHERSHIRQGDFYLQLIASLYASLFWFSPLGWWLKRKLNELGEAISDRAGLEEAASRSSYAQILLEFAALPRPTLTGVAMARTSHLSQRIERLLNESSFRQAFAAGRRRALLAVLLVPVALFAATALVRVEAAAAPAPQIRPAAQASFAGQSAPQQVTDQTSAPAPAPEAAPAPPASPAPAPDPNLQPVPPLPPDAAVQPGPMPMPAPPMPAFGAMPPMPPFRVRIDPAVAAEIAAARAEAEVYRNSGFAFTKDGYSYSDDGQAYALVGDPGAHISMNGGWDGNHSEDIEKARKIAHGHFLWFRHDGKSYIVDDPAIVAQLEAMDKPMDDLGEQMKALGKQMKDMGEQQKLLGQQMRAISIPTPDLTKEMAELSAAMEALKAKQGATISGKDLSDLQREIGKIQGELGSLQGKIGAQQGAIGGQMGQWGGKQGELGGQMGELGSEMGRIARENDAKIKGIITDSLSNGKAKPVE